MMKGRSIIRKCSTCTGLIIQPTILSGNTLGARFWTDAYRHAPMLPELPAMVMCPHCETPVWLGELEAVGTIIATDKRHKAFPDAQHHAAPTFEDYIQKLDEEAADGAKAKYLRVNAWWAGNHPRRKGRSVPPLFADEKDNLRALAPLLDETVEHDRLMIAEVMRELGEFEDAWRRCSEPFGEGIRPAVETIKRLAAQNNPYVMEIRKKRRPSRIARPPASWAADLARWVHLMPGIPLP